MENNLRIYKKDGTLLVIIYKWEFQDTYMGGQYITFGHKTSEPIAWAVGCYCEYRGQRFYLNYLPAATQSGKKGDSGEAFKYESVKFDSAGEELTRIVMLDIVESDGEYVPAMGTNYTGSSQFSLYCGETTVNGKTYTPVCALAEKIYANLVRFNKTLSTEENPWSIHVDITSTHKVNNVDVLNTHTDEKMLSFDNTTVRSALEMVNSEFDLDFSIQGRDIYIGYSLERLTIDEDITMEDGSHPYFYYGYGKGLPTITQTGGVITDKDNGTALYEIKRTSSSDQLIVTRLRALGSQKNMPYRYYNKKYPDLSQSMYPCNLQLPDTFETPEVKAQHNAQRKASGNYPDVRSVLGETNDAYIDKNDNAEGTDEGIREATARWDGSNADLEEIYPTIKEMTYAELKGASTPDMKGETDMTKAYPNYENTDRVDRLAGLGDLANYGDGLLAEEQTDSQGSVTKTFTTFTKTKVSTLEQWTNNLVSFTPEDLFTISSQSKGNYELTPKTGYVNFGAKLSSEGSTFSVEGKINVGYKLYVRDAEGNSLLLNSNGNTITCYKSPTMEVTSDSSNWASMEADALPDAKNAETSRVDKIYLSSAKDVVVLVEPYYTDFSASDRKTSTTDTMSLEWRFGLTYEQEQSGKVTSQMVWKRASSASTYMNTPFDLYLKDFGVQEMIKCFNTDEDAVISMTSGKCVGREFKIRSEVPVQTTIAYKGKTINVWKLSCARAQDDSLQRYYPSEVDPIAVDDTFVLLNVSMPESYVKAAEIRLLVASSLYLAENCDTRFTYQPAIDDIYLQRDYDRRKAEGKEGKSIYWKLYAGLKFPFMNMPTAEKPDPEQHMTEMTIETVVIKEGEGDTPKVEITLDDETETSTLQKMQNQISSITSSISSGNMDVAQVEALIRSIGAKRFLSKIDDDVANGKITFEKGAILKSAIASDTFITGAPTAGSGWQITRNGTIEADSLALRNFLEVPEIRFNRASVVVGTNIQSECGGIIEKVMPESDTTGVATLKLGDDDIAGSIQVGDLCWGYWHDIDDKSNNAEEDKDDFKGSINYQGFATVYFQVAEILNSNSTRFRYEIALDSTTGEPLGKGVHPYVGMHFGGRGNSALNEDGTPKYPSRQGFTISTPRYTATYQYVSSWDWSEMAKYVTYVSGLLDGFEVVANVTPGTWSNNWGTILGNVYYRGQVIEVSSAVRNMYITQSSNGVLQADEKQETVSIVIRDALFQDKTSDFDISINDVKVYSKGSEGGCVQTYTYDSLEGGVNRFKVVAEGTRLVRKWSGTGYYYETETYIVEDRFVIRKEAQASLSITTSIDNDPFIDTFEPKHIVCEVDNSLGVDMTSEVTAWEIQRGDYDDEGEWTQSDSDKIWGQRSKAVNFKGTIDLYWSDDVEINDLDLTKQATKFRVTATVGEKVLETLINI